MENLDVSGWIGSLPDRASCGDLKGDLKARPERKPASSRGRPFLRLGRGVASREHEGQRRRCRNCRTARVGSGRLPLSDAGAEAVVVAVGAGGEEPVERPEQAGLLIAEPQVGDTDPAYIDQQAIGDVFAHDAPHLTVVSAGIPPQTTRFPSP
jgi:hypothetical protein